MKIKFYFCLPIIIFFLLAFALKDPYPLKTIIVYSLTGICLLIGIFLLTEGQIKNRWPFVLHAMICTISALAFLLIVNASQWIIFFILLFSLIISLLFFNFYQFFYKPRLYKPLRIERMNIWLNFVLSYWACSTIGLLISPGLSYLTIFLFFFWLSLYPFLISSRGPVPWLKLLIPSLALTEIYICLRFLPLGIFANALIVSIFFLLIDSYFNSSKIKI